VNEEPEQLTSKIDQLDRRLITELQGDPRLAYATLGTRLGVTGMTAANRLQRLRQADLLRLRVAPNLQACGLTTEILGLVQAEVAALSRCIDILRVSPFVLRIDHVTGEYDLSFTAAFPSEAAMGVLVRELQSVAGVRRLVVHHRLETVKDDDGWSAVWAEPSAPEPSSIEVAPETRLPEHLKPRVATASAWLRALIEGDIPRLRELSTPDVVFTIMPPQAGAGTFEGIAAVEGEARIASEIYRQVWNRVIGVSEATAPYDLIIDTLNTAERTRGQVRTAFARLAYGFEGDRVRRVLSLSSMDLPEMPELEAGHSAGDR
jgi:DNA-binding Lrp family transcriptional regulator